MTIKFRVFEERERDTDREKINVNLIFSLVLKAMINS